MAAHGVHVSICGQGNDVPVSPPTITKGEIRESLLTLAQSVTTHVKWFIEPKVNAIESTITSKFRDFVRINPSIFLVYKVGESPKVYRLCVKGVECFWVTSREKAESTW